MESVFKQEIKKEIDRVVDLMVQRDAINESISELKKDIKSEYGLPVATITKITNIIRKQNLAEEDEKWQEIKELVEACS